MTTEVRVDPTFHYLRRKDFDIENIPEYKEYRRRWNENPVNHIVEDFPIHLDLEAVSGCNLRCFMCFQSSDDPKIKPEWDSSKGIGLMDFNLFKKIIDEGIKKGLCSIKLMFRGEPLLHPQIVDMVKYAKDKGVIEVMFNTNATLLTEDMAKALINAGLDKIICSIDGCTKEVYEKVRIGANFDVVLKNVKRLQELKKEMGLERPILRVQMVDTPVNHAQKDEYLEFWSKIADNVAIEDMNDWDDELKIPENPLISNKFCCPQLWQRLIILWDGDILTCCGDHYRKFVHANAKNVNIEDVWKGPKMEEFRELHKKGESHQTPLCVSCGLRKTVIKKYLSKE